MGNENFKKNKKDSLTISLKINKDCRYFLSLSKHNHIFKPSSISIESEKSMINFDSLRLLKSEKIINFSSKLLLEFFSKMLSKNTNLNMLNSCLIPFFTEFSYETLYEEDSFDESPLSKISSFAFDTSLKTNNKFVRFNRSNNDVFESINQYLNNKNLSRNQKTEITKLSKTVNKKLIYTQLDIEEPIDRTEVSPYDIFLHLKTNKLNKTLIYDKEAMEIERKNNKSLDIVSKQYRNEKNLKNTKFNSTSTQKLNKSKIMKTTIYKKSKRTNDAIQISKSILGANRIDYSNYIKISPINFSSIRILSNYENTISQLKQQEKNPSKSIINNYNIKIKNVMINKIDNNKN